MSTELKLLMFFLSVSSPSFSSKYLKPVLLMSANISVFLVQPVGKNWFGFFWFKIMMMSSSVFNGPFRFKNWFNRFNHEPETKWFTDRFGFENYFFLERKETGSMAIESGSGDDKLMDNLRSAVFKESESLDGGYQKITGYDFNRGVDINELLKSLSSTGFQASNLGDAIQVVNQMLDWRLSHEEPDEDCSKEECNPEFRESIKCKIFLGFTSNLVSSGIRETIRYLVEHQMVDVVVTTAGGIEEDLIKCLASTYKGDFYLPGAALRSKGLNRIGNLLVPNDNYCKFEDWIIPIFDKMLQEQLTENVHWTPSKVIARLGKEINDPSSFLYWASKNDVPVFCPSLTDGSLGDMLYFHSFHNPGLIIDIVQDIRAMNGEAVHANPRKTGIIVLGGGLPKHHICNANMMRNGADYAVFINTAQEFDGSDSGARPDEAISWGKIRSSAKSVKVHCDATIAFPLLVAGSFATRQ